MVRFIMGEFVPSPSVIKRIYIPIWLDLLYLSNIYLFDLIQDLHSNMVRFIIRLKFVGFVEYIEFTFQYG